MVIISSREFRQNQKKYLDLVDQKQQVIVQRGKNKSYLLSPITETDRLSVNPKLIEEIRSAEEEINSGKGIEIKDPENIWESIL